MENNRDNFENRKIARKKAIIRRNIFIALCVAIVILAALLIGFIVFAISSSGGEEGSESSSNISSSQGSELPSENSSSSLESSSSDISSDSSSEASESSSQIESSSQSDSSVALKAELDPEYSRLLLVNGENPLPSDFDYTGNLMLIEDKYLCGWRNQLDADVMPYATAMIEAAWADGVELYILSPYRSYDTQSTLFENEVQKWEKTGLDRAAAEEKASTVVARPGTSEHHTGLAIDFNSVEDSFESTPMYEWLSKNAQDYGFILRYTAEKQPITGVIHESWHWRFVGINEAKKIKASGLCLEEYLENNNNTVS